MTDFHSGVRSIQRITDIDVDEFRGIGACADEFKVARKVSELGIITAALDAPSAHDN
ncbi:Mycobacterium rhizamassiliense ORFan [Mycobacterium rhizamassiliense]|uniref:Mycobacterium rhizamassiliense ORFan n=1 Tax=Mycobacterium rhizamassiliense TaxID=1841860 RepID=A0A2U3P023_9MYCO|nr:hypothetical protein [Mycobacterium rhizamassiliense]SPM37102.1 Mycobacterium rhizamassiliense ORFan [Mycobacterium rhizamassiliense]